MAAACDGDRSRAEPYETRDWLTHDRGPLAIHAAKRPWNNVGEWPREARRIFLNYVTHHGAGLWKFGAVVCTADLVACIRTRELRGRIPADNEFWGDFSDGETGKGRYAFKFENVRTSG